MTVNFNIGICSQKQLLKKMRAHLGYLHNCNCEKKEKKKFFHVRNIMAVKASAVSFVANFQLLQVFGMQT